MSDHISRKELKQDKIHDAIEHGAEAFYLHKQFTLVVLLVILAGAIVYGSWTVYHDRQTATATVALDTAMKAYNGRIGGTPDPQDPSDVSYADEAARSNDALNKFNAVVKNYPNTLPGKQALYYAALCLQDLERHNQALEDLILRILEHQAHARPHGREIDVPSAEIMAGHDHPPARGAHQKRGF